MVLCRTQTWLEGQSSPGSYKYIYRRCSNSGQWQSRRRHRAYIIFYDPTRWCIILWSWREKKTRKTNTWYLFILDEPHAYACACSKSTSIGSWNIKQPMDENGEIRFLFFFNLTLSIFETYNIKLRCSALSLDAHFQKWNIFFSRRTRPHMFSQRKLIYLLSLLFYIYNNNII